MRSGSCCRMRLKGRGRGSEGWLAAIVTGQVVNAGYLRDRSAALWKDLNYRKLAVIERAGRLLNRLRRAPLNFS